MTGGGGASSAPSTQTQITDVPEWERQYVTDMLGRAQSVSNQPYQQFGGPQVAGFTPDQQAAFSQVEGLGGQYKPTQQAGVNSAMGGAQTASGIYSAGAPYEQQSLGYNPLMAASPYLGSASGYNSAAAGNPWMNAAANYQQQAAAAGTPQGIQDYMSPYTNNVVQGIENEANQNWNQKLMPGINDSFIGSGNFGSGRNTQVLGREAGNFQTGLSANVANALQSGYSMAGNQAAQQAQLLSGLGGQALTGAGTAGNLQQQQVGNLLNQAKTATDATQQQASNLQSVGTNLGNLAATQAGAQGQAGSTLGSLAGQQLSTGLTAAQALQATGQQQQQQNQLNLDTAKQDWQTQQNYPASQLQFLNSIIRGLPAQGTGTTQSGQTTAGFAPSPLSAIGGAGAGALSLYGPSGQLLGNLGKKKGGLIKKYADGGLTDDQYETDLQGVASPLVDDSEEPKMLSPLVGLADISQKSVPSQAAAESTSNNPNPLTLDEPTSSDTVNQREQLLAMARGMLTPTKTGSSFESLGNAFGNIQDVRMQQQKMDIESQRANALNEYKKWQMENNVGKGAYDTMARMLMKEDPNLSYEQALYKAHNVKSGIPLTTSPASTQSGPTQEMGADTTKPISTGGNANIDPETGDVTQTKFGFDVSNIPPKVFNSMATEDSKRRQADVNNMAVAKNVLRSLDQLEPNLDKVDTGSTFTPAEVLAARTFNSKGKIATAAGNIDKNTNDLAMELGKFQYMPGMRSSVLGLQTILASKPGLQQPEQTNKNIVNSLRAKVTDYKLTGELAQQYREASPLKITDQNAYKLDDALKEIYPLEEVDKKTGAVTFNKENVKKIQEAIPDAIANPHKYFKMAKSGGGNNNSIPEGAVPTGNTVGGKKVYKLPDGRGWMEP